MRSSYKLWFFHAAFFACILGGPTLAPQQPIMIKISTTQNVFKTGSEVILHVMITNNSAEDVSIGLAVDRTSPMVAGHLLQVYVRGDQGNIPAETKYQRALRGEAPASDLPVTSMVAGRLPSGKNSGNAIIVIANKYYDLSKPGRYQIHMQWTDPISKITVRSNMIEITMTAVVLPAKTGHLS